MRKFILLKVSLVLGLLVIIASAGATGAGSSLDPELEKFLNRFRSAAKSEDASRLRDLSHSISKACVQPGSEVYYERIIQGMIRVFGHDLEIKDISYKTTDTKALEKDMARMAKRGMNWPVPPDGIIVVKYEKPGGARVANLHVAKDNDRWTWVHVCKN